MSSIEKGRYEISPLNFWLYGISGRNIAIIIGDPCGPKKELLPDIINAAVKRLSN